jgi:hypothetical protein
MLLPPCIPFIPYLNLYANPLYPHIYRVEPPKGVAKTIAVGVAKRNLRGIQDENRYLKHPLTSRLGLDNPLLFLYNMEHSFFGLNSRSYPCSPPRPFTSL